MAGTMTSDGISGEDWDRIRALAVDVVNASAVGEDLAERTRLFEALDGLERKYGRLPSILATRGDFAESTNERVTCLLDGFALATERSDRSNQLFIADSLARTYIQDLCDVDRGRQWLDVLAGCLRQGGGESDINDYEALEEAWTRLRNRG